MRTRPPPPPPPLSPPQQQQPPPPPRAQAGRAALLLRLRSSQLRGPCTAATRASAGASAPVSPSLGIRCCRSAAPAAAAAVSTGGVPETHQCGRHSSPRSRHTRAWPGGRGAAQARAGRAVRRAWRQTPGRRGACAGHAEAGLRGQCTHSDLHSTAQPHSQLTPCGWSVQLLSRRNNTLRGTPRDRLRPHGLT